MNSGGEDARCSNHAQSCSSAQEAAGSCAGHANLISPFDWPPRPRVAPQGEATTVALARRRILGQFLRPAISAARGARREKNARARARATSGRSAFGWPAHRRPQRRAQLSHTFPRRPVVRVALEIDGHSEIARCQDPTQLPPNAGPAPLARSLAPLELGPRARKSAERSATNRWLLERGQFN